MAVKGLREAMAKAGSGAKMLKIKNGGNATVRLLQGLDDMHSVFEHTLKKTVGGNDSYYTHTCIGKENGCPTCATGAYATLRTYIPVIDLTDPNSPDVKIWKVSKTVGESIVQLEDEYGNLMDYQIKWTRSGQTNKPVYTPLSVKQATSTNLADFIEKIPDIEKMTAEKSRETLIAEIDNFNGGSGGNGGGDNYDGGNDNSGGYDQGGSNDNAGGAGGDDDYPF